MEALKLKTLNDLVLSPDERVELIGGEIVRRPMARFAHAAAQGNLRGELHPLVRGAGPGGGWWFATEVSVAYEVHDCPSHDLAGWRRERLPRLPDGVIELPPDWVCEIVSPGHETKDTRYLPLLLKRHRVPFYWLIWPEERTLVAYALDDGDWRVIATLKDQDRARIPPFEAIELDLADLLADG
ncbi:MAG: Uma2 family endonuclease [Lamprocystis purpurea]|uniref:Uma2 family endonuclease n=1 Tax=Lamprocystis purpurea TaxID=61598 RepID=UPI000373163B|nr:Uma2 family endonuclease [Lamprocystis purpurea]MBV5274666.1 Uma2 family endonuclease [Lamprocystis purpurea]